MSEGIISHILEDIIRAIEATERFVDQMDLAQFLEDEKTIKESLPPFKTTVLKIIEEN